jgi:hypothetical protein
VVKLVASERVIEMPAEWGGIVPTQVFLDEGERIVDEATKAGVPLRLLGGVAIRCHCAEYTDFAKKLGREVGEGEQEYTDLDYMSYIKFRDPTKKLFETLGYGRRKATLSTAATQRQVYFHPKGWFHVDVFFDKLLAANHPIDFRKRLELDSPTVSVTDLFLEKAQIVFPGEKDVKDLILLLHAHEVVAQEEVNKVNGKFIAQILSSDWGFWYTLTTNLRRLQEYSGTIQALSSDDRQDLTSKIDLLMKMIDEEPKSSGWKMRSVIGNKKKWYNPVETTQTVGEFGLWKLQEKPK